MRNAFLFMVLALGLGGCASSQVPVAIRQEPAVNPSIGAAVNRIESHRGMKVRWGGTVASVQNNQADSLVEVVGRNLDSQGYPLPGDTNLGRFMARVRGFIDPAIYKQGRSVTVAGTIEDKMTRNIGEHPYTYPVVRADNFYLWPNMANVYGRYPGYYDPYFYPYYGYPGWGGWGPGWGYGPRVRFGIGTGWYF